MDHKPKGKKYKTLTLLDLSIEGILGGLRFLDKNTKDIIHERNN